ncbi:MAG: hypothetical protein ACRCS8_03310 [Brevinema sp.]
MRKHLLLVFFFVSGSLFGQAKERRVYQDPASLAMGGIGVASFGHAFSPNFNPAALGLMADYDIAPFLTLGFDFDLNLVNAIVPQTSNGEATQIKMNGPLSLGYMGKGFGIWTTSSAQASYENFQGYATANDSYAAKFLAELTLNIGYGYKIPFASIDDVSGLSLGAVLRFSQRFRTDQYDAATRGDGKLYQGSSFSSDFGASLRIQNWILAASVRDALSTGYKWESWDKKTTQEDSKIPYSVDFGTSYQFLFRNNFIQHIALYMEFHDATDNDIDWLNKMRLGADLKLFNFLSLRVGMYQTFLTTGFGMNWKWGRIDFAYYRDADLYTYQKEQDRFNVSFTIGLENTPKRKLETKARKEGMKRYYEEYDLQKQLKRDERKREQAEKDSLTPRSTPDPEELVDEVEDLVEEIEE